MILLTSYQLLLIQIFILLLISTVKIAKLMLKWGLINISIILTEHDFLRMCITERGTSMLPARASPTASLRDISLMSSAGRFKMEYRTN